MKIIHIAQFHKIPFGAKPFPEVFDGVVRSQLSVARFIRQNPSFPVLVEGVYKDYEISENPILSFTAKMVFPDGIPEDFNALSSLQKDFLYDYGGPKTLLFLREIPVIYKSARKEIMENIDRKIKEGDAEYLLHPREREAIDCAKEVKANKLGDMENATVYLVFGAGHDFKKYCELYGENIQIERLETRTDALGNVIHPSSNDVTPNYNSVLKTVMLQSEKPKEITLLSRVKPSDSREKHSRLDDELSCQMERVKRFRKSCEQHEKFNKHQNILKIQNNPLIPEALKKAIAVSGLGDFITNGYVTIEKLIDLHNERPWVIQAMLCCNIIKGINDKIITVDQLAALNEEQIISIKHKFYDSMLKEKVEEYTQDLRADENIMPGPVSLIVAEDKHEKGKEEETLVSPPSIGYLQKYIENRSREMTANVSNSSHRSDEPVVFLEKSRKKRFI